MLELQTHTWSEMAKFGKMVLILLGLQSYVSDFLEVRILKGLREK